MNILYINHYAGSPQHGMEFRPYYLAREWVKKGHQVQIVAADYSHLRRQNPDMQGQVYRDELIDGIQYTWCKTPLYQGNGVKRVINIFRFLSRVMGLSKRYTSTFRPDVIIASSTYPLDMVPAAYLANKTGAKLVYEVHDLWPLTPVEVGGMSPKHPFIRLMQWAENFAYQKADRVVSMLPLAKDHMLAHGMAEEKYGVIPNGIVLSEWAAGQTPLPESHQQLLDKQKADGQFVIGYAGGHGLANALDYLLEAAKSIQDQPIQLVLVGDGPDKVALMDRAKKMGLNNVHFLPAITKTAIPAFLQACDALYIGWRRLPIYRFGLNPNKLFDYMMAGRPVIHSLSFGNDMVKDAQAGISVAAEAPSEIAQALIQMANTPADLRQAMGWRGQQYILQNHNYESLAAHFLEMVCRTPRQ